MGPGPTDRLVLRLDRLLSPRSPEAASAPPPQGPAVPAGGRVLWLQLRQPGDAGALAPVAERLAGEFPGVQPLLAAMPPDPDPFLDRLRPAAAVLTGTPFQPAPVAALKARGIPVVGAMLRAPSGHWLERRLARPLARRLLGAYAALLAEDEDSLARLRRAGAPAGRLAVSGAFAAPVPVPRGNPSEQQSLTELMKGRPLWLAAALPLAELPAMAAAHRLALRRAHRLLLVVVPERVEDAPAMQAELAANGLVSGLRSAGEDPEDEVSTYVADLEGELGLWLRLAAVSFQGGTLTPGTPSRSPMEAAALGSAILHGPETAPHAADYARLAAAGAARQVATPEALAAEIDRLIAPDQAAAMAHAAWEIASAGDEAAGALAARLRPLLEGGR